MKKFFICLLSMFLMISLAACGSGEAESASTAGELTRKLKNKSDKVIEVSEDIVLTKAIEIVGNKEIVGSGSITVSVADMEEGYVISLSDGAKLTIGGSVKFDLSGLAGGIHVKEGTELILQDEAVVTGASVKAANVLVEGTFTMNGGFLKYAKGHNLINKGNTTIAGGELKGSGSKYAIVYNEGTLVQNDGTIVGGYHNVVGASGSSFEWNKGEITTSLQNAIVIEEGASIHVTSADAKLTGVYAKGLVVNGEGVIDGATMKDSMDSMVAVGINGKLTLNGGKITEAGVHGVDNAGTLLMTDGVVFGNAHSGICNTGTLDITGGDIMNNGSKGVLNKAGVATITSADVMITGNEEGVSNEIGAYFELSAADIIQNTDCNVYAYGGEMYIHDITLSSSKAASISVTAADIILENVDIQGTTGGSGAHGIYMTGGHVVAKKVNFNAINGSGLRLDGEAAVFEGKNITFDNIQRNVFYVTAGKADVDGFTTKDVQNYNVYATGGELTLANATLCKTYQNNVRTKNDTVLNLKNVVILGNTEEVAGTVYGLIIDDGTVTAKNLTIKDTYAAAIRLKGGEFSADKVTITNAGKHGINAAGGVAEIKNLKTSGVTGCNVYMTQNTKLTLTDAELGKCTDNSIKEYGKEDAVLNLTNVTILGHTEDALESVYGLIVDNGTVTAKNLKIQDVVAAGLRVRGGSLTADDVIISDTGLHGINVKSGTTKITNLTTTNVTGCNIYMTGDANLAVTNAVLGKCTDNSIKEYGKEKAVLNLTDVTILGHTEDALASVHGLIIDDGTVTAKNVKIQDVVSAGLRVRGGSFTAEDVVVSNPGLNGMYMNGGTADITGLTVSTARNYGVYMTGGTSSITDLKISDVSKCNIYMTKASNLTVTNAELGKCKSHSISIPEGATKELALNLTDVVVLGHTGTGTYINGLLMYNGSVTANNLEIRDVISAGVRVVGGNLKAEGVTVSDAGTNGVYVSGTGVADITNLTTSDVNSSNILMTENANLTVTGAELGKCKSHSIQIPKGATEDLVLKLNDVTVLGHTKEAGSSTHGLIMYNGSVTANNLEVNDVISAGVRVVGGNFKSEVLKVSDTGTHGVYVSSGTADITALTTSGANSCNINVTGDANLTVTTGTLGESKEHSINMAGEDAILNLTDVTVLGHVEDADSEASGLMIENGTVTATILNIHDTVSHGINMTSGTANITTLTTSGVGKSNILLDGTAKLAVSDATLGKCYSHGIKVEQDSNAVLNLTDVEVLGHADDAKGYINGVYVYGGSMTAKNLNIHDVIRDGLFVNGGSASVENLTVSDVSRYGVWLQAGSLTLNGADVTGKKYDIYNQTSNLTLSGVIKAGVYNDAAWTVNAGSLAGSDMTIDWGVQVDEGFVGIQFENNEDMTATSTSVVEGVASVRLGDVVRLNVNDAEGNPIDPVENYYNSQMVLVDPDNMLYKVDCYDSDDTETEGTYGLKQALADIEAKEEYERATITIAGDIIVPSTITIPEGKNVTLVDDGSVRNIVRDTSSFDEAKTSVLFKVENNASLTFKSTGTDASPLLVVNGSKNSYKNISANWAIVQSLEEGSKVNVNEGVKFIDNSSARTGGVIKMTAGTLTVNGGTFSGNISSKKGGVLIIESGVTATIKNATFTGNAGLQGGAILIANGSQVSIEGCTFSGNTANENGGAITNENKTAGKVTIKNCTFTDNEAPLGEAINMASESRVVLEDCTFTNNDISVADSTAQVHISGKMVAEIFNEGANVLYVDGTLEDGSDVKVEWNDTVPTDGIIFASDAVMNASKPYISLGDKVFAKYSLAYVNATDTTSATGKLVAPIVVSNADDWAAARTTIATDKIGVIRLKTDISVTAKIEIPADCNVTIEDDGSGTAYTLAKSGTTNFDMFYLLAGSSLTLRSTGTVGDCKLILTGLTTTTNASTAMINLEKDNCAVSIYNGVTLKDNSSAKGGGAICINNASATFNVNGACFENITAVANGGAIYLKSEGTINNSIFKDCSSEKAGGAIIVYSSCDITDTKFDNCSSGTHGGAIYNSSGNLTLTGTLSKALFYSNETGDDSSGGAIYMTGTATLTVTGYTFEENSAKNGGAIYVNGGICNIKNTKFDTCNASNAGAAIYSKGTLSLVGDSENAVIKNCNCSNENTDYNTAIYLNSGTLTGSGYSFEAIDESNKFLKATSNAKNNSSYK